MTRVASTGLITASRILYNNPYAMSESTLHTDIKRWYAQPGDLTETPLEDYIVDLIRGDLLIEIQTRNFSAIRPKLDRLLDAHAVRLVYPIAQEKWIVRDDPAHKGKPKRRKSPRRGRLEDVFYELVHAPHLLAHPNFTLEVLLIQEEDTFTNDGKGSWRRKGWSLSDRRLLEVTGQVIYSTPGDFQSMLPHSLPQPFTTRELADALKIKRNLATRMTYCLRAMHVIHLAGKRGKANLYESAKDHQG